MTPTEVAEPGQEEATGTPVTDPAALTEQQAPAAEGAAPAAPAFNLDAVKDSPEFQDYVSRERARAITEGRQAWDRDTAERIRAQAANDERTRAAQERTDLVTKAKGGDLDAQARLADDEYARLVESNTRTSAYAALAREADEAVLKVANGDADLIARLDFRRFNSIPEWTQAMAEARADQRVATEVETKAQARAEALAASQLAALRNNLPNPDTHDSVGGTGGPNAFKTQEDVEASYARAKQSGDADEVVRLRSLLKSSDFRRLPKSA